MAGRWAFVKSSNLSEQAEVIPLWLGYTIQVTCHLDVMILEPDVFDPGVK